MEEPKSAKFKITRNWIIALVVVVLILGAGFYWVAIRPERIRHNCNITAINSLISSLGYTPSSKARAAVIANNTYSSYHAYQTAYDSCVANAGLPSSQPNP